MTVIDTPQTTTNQVGQIAKALAEIYRFLMKYSLRIESVTGKIRDVMETNIGEETKPMLPNYCLDVADFFLEVIRICSEVPKQALAELQTLHDKIQTLATERESWPNLESREKTEDRETKWRQEVTALFRCDRKPPKQQQGGLPGEG